MDIGMLWYDDTQRELNEKVARAVEHYKTKYGATPTVCFVHPDMLPPKSNLEIVAGIQLRPARTVLRHHFWVGVETVAEATNGNGHKGHGANGKGARRKK